MEVGSIQLEVITTSKIVMIEKVDPISLSNVHKRLSSNNFLVERILAQHNQFEFLLSEMKFKDRDVMMVKGEEIALPVLEPYRPPQIITYIIHYSIYFDAILLGLLLFVFCMFDYQCSSIAIVEE